MNPNPWDTRPSESAPAYAAFAEYRELGPERSLEAVRLKVGKNPRLIARWSSNWNWVERARAYDAHLDAVRQSERRQSIAKKARKIMTADEVKEGLTFIAQADIAEVFEADGTFDLAKAKGRGATKQIKSLSFDKDTGRVTKIEIYSAHEGHRDMAKVHGAFIDRVETTDTTERDPVTVMLVLLNDSRKLNGQPPVDRAYAEAALEASIQRAKMR